MYQVCFNEVPAEQPAEGLPDTRIAFFRGFASMRCRLNSRLKGGTGPSRRAGRSACFNEVPAEQPAEGVARALFNAFLKFCFNEVPAEQPAEGPGYMATPSISLVASMRCRLNSRLKAERKPRKQRSDKGFNEVPAEQPAEGLMFNDWSNKESWLQ